MDESMPEIEGMLPWCPRYLCLHSRHARSRPTTDGACLNSGLGGGWTFEPAERETDADAYMVPGVAEDDYYLDFGYWIVEGPDDTYTVGTYGRAIDGDTYGTV